MTAGGPTNLIQLKEGQLRAVLDGVPSRIAMLDREFRHCYVNEAYAASTSLSAAHIIGQTLADVMGRASCEQLRPLGDRALAGETGSWEGWVLYPGGPDPRFILRVCTPYHGESGAIEGYFVVDRDLTDLKQNERRLAEQVDALKTSQAINAAISDSALDCIVVIDEVGRVIAFNPAAERTFGYSRTQAIGEVVGDLIVPPAMRARHKLGFQRYLETGEAHMLGRRIELEGMRADGSCFPVELAITEVRLAGQRLFTAYVRDLTQAKRDAAEIQRQREALHQSEKMAAFGSLLAGVAHELNNPLSIVLGNALMLEEDARESDVTSLADRAGVVHSAAERCARIVRSFLAIARQHKAEMRPVAIGQVVDDALGLLLYGLRADGIEIELDVPADLPDVLGDADQLSQIVTNLLVNARQALETKARPRHIRIAALKDSGGVMLSISDDGPGIPEVIRSRIFDPFFTTKAVGAGTGIGLAVSRGIAEAHGGTLNLDETIADGGTRFVLWLPSCAGASVRAGASAEAIGTKKLGTALVVEDEPGVSDLLAQMLARQGYKADTASGEQAQALLSGREYDLILCDLHMPGVDGAAIYAWIQTHKPHLSARTAFVTGDTLGPAAVRFLKQAERPVLEKPFSPADLKRLIAQMPVPDDLATTDQTETIETRDRRH